jgi:hypothetical protein
VSGIYNGGHSQKACPACYTVNQAAAAFCVGCGAHFLPIAPPPAPPRAPSTIQALPTPANTGEQLRPTWSKTQVYGEGYELARRHLDEVGARDENITLAVIADTGLPGARSCALLTERRLIVVRMLGTGSPLAMSLLWYDAGKLQWVESPRGVILAFTTRSGQKVTIEGLSANEARQIVDFAIDHGNRLSVDLSGAAPHEPAQPPAWMPMGEQTIPSLRHLKTGPLLARRARPSKPLGTGDLKPLPPADSKPLAPAPPAQEPASGAVQKQTQKGSLMGAMRNAITSLNPVKKGRASGPLESTESEPLQAGASLPVSASVEPQAAATPSATIVMTAPGGSKIDPAPRVPDIAGGISGPITSGPLVAGTLSSGPIATSGPLSDEDHSITDMLKAEGLEPDIAPFVPPEAPDTMMAAYAPAEMLQTGPNLAPRPRLNKPVLPPSTIGPDPVARMRQLREMLETGLISEEEFAQKKQEILARM